MGSPVSPIVANLYMEYFEREALCTASTHLGIGIGLWMILCHLSRVPRIVIPGSYIDPAIKFTVEGNQENGAIPFLDTLVKPEADNSLSISVYRKPTHTDKYLQWDSYHNLAAKYSVIGTLTHRAKTVCTGPELFNKEIQHLREALSRCNYPI